MEIIFLLITTLLLVIVYWFRNNLINSNKKHFSLALISLLWGAFAASVILETIKYTNLDNIILYSWVFWPLIEEIWKFIIVYVIYKVFRDYFSSNLWWLGMGIMVGIWFWIYENIIYITYGINDIQIILYRTIFVWWILIHPLTTWIYGYILAFSDKLPKQFPFCFSKEKEKFNNIENLKQLISFIYKSSKGSIKAVIKLFLNILILDTTVKHILGEKRNISKHWHWPVEVILEWLMLWVWIHIIYNTLLGYISEPNIFLAIVGSLVTLLITRLFMKIYHSKFIGIIITLIIISSFWIPSEDSSLLIISLIILMLSLISLSWELNKKINQ